VRELKGVVDYMATMASGSLITENYFPDFLVPAEHRNRDHSESRHHHFKADYDPVLLSTAVEHTEKEVIKEVLQKARTRSEAIKILGISRRTFYTKLKQYNLG
jgi:DNA-binding NtrC family response regulator